MFGLCSKEGIIKKKPDSLPVINSQYPATWTIASSMRFLLHILPALSCLLWTELLIAAYDCLSRLHTAAPFVLACLAAAQHFPLSCAAASDQLITTKLISGRRLSLTVSPAEAAQYREQSTEQSSVGAGEISCTCWLQIKLSLQSVRNTSQLLPTCTILNTTAWASLA